MWRSDLRDALEEEIANGAFGPGERLDEAALAARFGVSRTPIREALMQLAAIGLIEARPQRGMVVTSPSAQRLVEMFEVMGELEGMVGRLAARRWTDEDRVALEGVHEACRDAAATGDADTYYYENEKFHRALYAASHNAFLLRECDALHRRLKPYRRLQLRSTNRVAESFEEHEAVVRAVLRRDPNQAQSLLRDHVIIQGDRFVDLIAFLRAMQRDVPGSAARKSRKTRQPSKRRD